MTSEHPMYLAQELAALLERDPVAAGQIKEHITEERLRELLGIVPEVVEEEVEVPYNEIREAEDDALLREIALRKIPASRVLRFINAAA